MAARVKYDYSKAIEIIMQAAKTNQDVTKEDLMIAITGEVIKGYKETSKFATLLNGFRKRQLKRLNIDLVPVHVNDCKHSKTTHYKVVTLKEEIKQEDNTKSFETDMILSSLQKSNQKLFLQLEDLKAKHEALEKRCMELCMREANYKSIIESYHALTMC